MKIKLNKFPYFKLSKIVNFFSKNAKCVILCYCECMIENYVFCVLCKKFGNSGIMEILA